ncbi:MAG: hypothetical protein ACRD0Z_09670 [Acidimicrobiales bacterium]
MAQCALDPEDAGVLEVSTRPDPSYGIDHPQLAFVVRPATTRTSPSPAPLPKAPPPISGEVQLTRYAPGRTPVIVYSPLLATVRVIDAFDDKLRGESRQAHGVGIRAPDHRSPTATH